MNRSVIAAIACTAAVATAAAVPRAADTDSANGDSADSANSAAALSSAPRGLVPPPFWATGRCKQKAKITVKSYYSPAHEVPNRVRLSVRHAEPRTDVAYSLTVIGDGDAATFGKGRTDADGRFTNAFQGSTGFHRVVVSLTAEGGERCRLEVAGQVSPVP